MIILMTILIVMLCLTGAVVALRLIDNGGKGRRWPATEEGLTPQRPYPHVAQGPDSLYAVRRGRTRNATDATPQTHEKEG